MTDQKNNQTKLYTHLVKKYDGVFDTSSMDNCLTDYVGFTFTNYAVDIIKGLVPQDSSILDIGSGFGSFVITANLSGYKAFGIEIEKFDVRYARNRLVIDAPALEKQPPFLCADGLKLPFNENTFDVVTLWNVLEHFPNSQLLLNEVKRILRPNGIVFIICPNYAAFREEAHYHVPWFPLLPRFLAHSYLKLLGKDPYFFKSSIFYRTNWGVLYQLSHMDFEISMIGQELKKPFLQPDNDHLEKLSNPDMIESNWKKFTIKIIKRLRLDWALRFLFTMRQHIVLLKDWAIYYSRFLKRYNPFIESITLFARKR